MEWTRRAVIVWLNYLYFENRDILSLEKALGDIRELPHLKRETIASLGLLTSSKLERLFTHRDVSQLEKILEDYERHHIHIRLFGEEGYPDVLSTIDDPPAVLYQKGAYTRQDQNAIAIVGSRKCTPYGKQIAQYFGEELSKRGITIISGLAYGIDAVAHAAAIDACGRTIAVMGTGINVIHPKRNTHLYHEIAQKGVIFSEFPAGTEGLARNFPRRNRIISGLSQGVLIVEAQDRSGTLITANFAAEQGREVFCVPGNITSAFSVGTNRLIQDGAKLVLRVDDIFEEIDLFSDLLSARQDTEERNHSDLSCSEQNVLQILSSGEYTVDYLALRLGMDVSETQVLLTGLELQDCIEASSRGTYRKKLR